ncbi:hypothetical protein ABH935_006378 [Catenulispora sp. GAS73]|uniref:aspartyl/asparaginyl beta-hydroxylase domain-containing protein n=1 Tax=Catenulispora sp. GAS73 TaxID=3156269 RepID=UPI0035156CAB
MASALLGRLDLDNGRLAPDIAALGKMPQPPETYDEFTSGRWVNLPLMNASGCGSDGLFVAGTKAVPTELLAEVPYIAEFISQNFSSDRLFMVRARDVTDWFILPHRDYLELDDPANEFYRVIIVLEDNPHTVNSDEDIVFKMRKGEVWHLDAAQAHSGINDSHQSRWSLCLDFRVDAGFSPADVFADRKVYDPTLEPSIVDRKPLSEADLQDRLNALSKIVNRYNIRDVAFLLGKAHLTEQLPTAAVWQWLIDITRDSDDAQLVDLAERAFDYFVRTRRMHETFSFTVN